MNDISPNLFSALFDFHPRDDYTPAENFLTEAFAYLLVVCEGARKAWLSHAIGEDIEVNGCEVLTRERERDHGGRPVIPDMKISGNLRGGKRFILYSEHKWDSPCESSQLKKYLRLAGHDSHVVFIGASDRQVNLAKSCDRRMDGKVFLWADVFNVLDEIHDKPTLLAEFLDFMNVHGLSPGLPITTEAMVGFINSGGFLNTLQSLTNKLYSDFDWNFIPERYRQFGEAGDAMNVSAKYGRMAIEFATPDWKPTVTVGFLYDERDHKVKFVDRAKGIDLLLRIETDPANQSSKRIQYALSELNRKKEELSRHAQSALVRGDRGNGNKHTLIIVRSCLDDVIKGQYKQKAQLNKIHAMLRKWCEILFEDGAVEKAFKKSGLDSGM